MPEALKCSSCGDPSDGWPDSTSDRDGELCQNCWEKECSGWRMAASLPVAAAPKCDLREEPAS